MRRYKHTPPKRPQRSTRTATPTTPRASKSQTTQSHGKDGSTVPNVFHKLPVEMMHEIVHWLPSDEDLCNFQLSFRHADAALKDGHFWRKRFKDVFDAPRDDSFIKANGDFEDQYKKRKEVLLHKPNFRYGNSRREVQCLAVLKDLILDACSDRKPGNSDAYVSKNIHNYISKFLVDSNLLEEIFARKFAPKASNNKDTLQCGPNPLMRMLQILLAPSLLDPRPFGPNQEPQIADFQLSQYMAYSSVRQQPIFGGCNGVDVNFTWTLHQLNFWRAHMLCASEATLNASYKLFADYDRPQYWSTLLKPADVDFIRKKWKGAYAFVSENHLRDIRVGGGDHEHIQDEFNGEESSGDFQDLKLELTEDDGHAWLPLFEDILRSLTPPRTRIRTRAQKASSPAMGGTRSRSFRFGGAGEDQEETFLADGWLNPLPPQQGVPGWQRMTMMKYFVDEDTGHIDSGALWAYEGVVLPGGQIILGRWWSPLNSVDGQKYSGPFILWCVDDGIALR